MAEGKSLSGKLSEVLTPLQRAFTAYGMDDKAQNEKEYERMACSALSFGAITSMQTVLEQGPVIQSMVEGYQCCLELLTLALVFRQVYALVTPADLKVLRQAAGTTPASLRSAIKNFLARYDELAPSGCSDPACFASPVAGVSLLKCGRCRTARYCSKACQRAHWAAHKTSCIPKEKQAGKAKGMKEKQAGKAEGMDTQVAVPEPEGLTSDRVCMLARKLAAQRTAGLQYALSRAQGWPRLYVLFIDLLVAPATVAVMTAYNAKSRLSGGVPMMTYRETDVLGAPICPRRMTAFPSAAPAIVQRLDDRHMAASMHQMLGPRANREMMRGVTAEELEWIPAVVLTKKRPVWVAQAAALKTVDIVRERVRALPEPALTATLRKMEAEAALERPLMNNAVKFRGEAPGEDMAGEDLPWPWPCAAA